ncbi:MAG: hypothetical protein Q9227_007661 [Pyrenula ochraceoflavens]
MGFHHDDKNVVSTPCPQLQLNNHKTHTSDPSKPAVMTYQANNIRGQWKRAFCSATLVGFGGIGGIAGSLVFRSQDAPGYVPGIIAAITYVPLFLFSLY